ncbi:MAG TPA: hypothetical protein VMR31_12655 [Myxococcota bacterium]|nr:hypothetical protein [Myxococcota bacterium]
MKDEILRRIERDAGVPELAELLAARIQQADLHSLLLEVFRRRAAARAPADVLADWEANRLVRASTADPRALARFDAAAFARLPDGFEPLELSPVCPLGTSSVLGTVHQDKALASARSVEVLSDATNVLALECAARRRASLRADARSTSAVHLAASHRHLRTQAFAGPLSFAHFRLFALASAGRDARGERFAEAALAAHLRFHARVAREFLGPGFALRIGVTDLAPGEPRARLLAGVPGVEVVAAPERTSGRGYYTDLCFKIHARRGAGDWLELGDGGAVDWTAKLLSNQKERLFISGISSERIMSLAAEPS